MFSRWNHERDFRPLYSSLAPEDAAAVLAKVRESGSEFRLSENGSVVLVPSARVAELRLQMAAAGLPKSGRIGFELFDKSNFGASDFTEQVNYHRALEGELERTVMSLAEVEQARVHITFPKDSLFLDSRQPAKASVLVKLRAGAQLVAAKRGRDLPARSQRRGRSAAGGGFGGGHAGQSAEPGAQSLLRPTIREPSEAALEYRQKLEHDLLAKISHTLDPLLGADKFRATASVECDFSSAEQSEETYDPGQIGDREFAKDRGHQRRRGGSGHSGHARPPCRAPPRGRPAAATRLRAGPKTSATNPAIRCVTYASRRARSNACRSRCWWIPTCATKARERRPSESWSRHRRTKLKAISDLVAGVIGLSTERGDQLVVETLPFESTLNPEQLPPANPAPPPPPSWQEQIFKNRLFVIGVAAGAALLLGLLFIVLRVMRKKRRAVPFRMPGGTPSWIPPTNSRDRSKAVWPNRRRCGKSRRWTL